MQRSIRPFLRRARTAVLAVAAASLLATGCGSDSGGDRDAQGGGSAGSGAYPLSLKSPFATQEIKKKPERVAVVSTGDLDIALALGVEPVISMGVPARDPWTQKQLDSLGIKKLKTYDATDSTDFAAIAEAKPDVILATNSWTLADDFELLSKIAPVVAHTSETTEGMSWEERTLLAGKVLDREERAKKSVAAVAKAFADARTAHPGFEGRTFTYAVMHPNQITYMSHPDWDAGFFTDLGFERPETAAEFGKGKEAVSIENIDKLDADLLTIGYPFGDEGVITRDKLEKDRLFNKLTAVREDHYMVMDQQAASPLAYPTVLSQPWVLERILPDLAEAVG